MRRKKLILSFLIVLSLFFIFSFFFVEKNHYHNCPVVNCEICEQVFSYERKLNELKQSTSSFSSLNNLTSFFSTYLNTSNNEFMQIYTLISLKTELLA